MSDLTKEAEAVNMTGNNDERNDGNTYKVILREPEFGTEEYVENLSKAEAMAEADKRSGEAGLKVYIEWTDASGGQGYLNRDGGMDCPGEPW